LGKSRILPAMIAARIRIGRPENIIIEEMLTIILENLKTPSSIITNIVKIAAITPEIKKAATKLRFDFFLKSLAVKSIQMPVNPSMPRTLISSISPSSS